MKTPGKTPENPGKNPGKTQGKPRENPGDKHTVRQTDTRTSRLLEGIDLWADSLKSETSKGGQFKKGKEGNEVKRNVERDIGG